MNKENVSTTELIDNKEKCKQGNLKNANSPCKCPDFMLLQNGVLAAFSVWGGGGGGGKEEGCIVVRNELMILTFV
jgi:hypothetical protein